MQSKKTRCAVRCAILGVPKKMTENVLPTIEDTLKELLWTEHELSISGVNLNSVGKRAVEALAIKVEGLWRKTLIPVISHQRIVGLIQKHHCRRQALNKSFKRSSTSESYQSKLEEFRMSSQKLLDIAICKCLNLDACVCMKNQKVSLLLNSVCHNQTLFY
jgi:hypothetical protein